MKRLPFVPSFSLHLIFFGPAGLAARVMVGVLLSLLTISQAVAAEPEGHFPFSVASGSENWISIPVHRPAVFEGEVLEVSGRMITFTERFCEPDCDDISAFAVVSVSDQITVMTGTQSGVRGRILWSSDRSVVIEPNINIEGVTPGDVIRISPGWRLGSLFPPGTPDGTQVMLFEPRPRGIKLAASSIYEYSASLDAWHDAITGNPAGDLVLHETEAFLLRDPRSPDGAAEAYDLVLSGGVSGLTPRVDLGGLPENAPQEIHFGVPAPVTLGDSGLGVTSGDRLHVMPPSGGTTPVTMYVYFSGLGWFEGGQNVDDRELEPGAVYIYRSWASDTSGTVSTFSLLIQEGNFLNNTGELAPKGSVYGILVDTTGAGFDPAQFGPFPSFVPGDRAVFLRRPDGSPTGIALVYAGELPDSGFIGGAAGIRHKFGGGVAETGDRWALIWFPGVSVGATPKAWRGFGLYTNPDMTIPEEGRTASFADDITSEPKSADWFPVTPIELNSFEAWTAAHFYPDERENPERESPVGDPETTGVPNLLRYAFDLDPRRPLPMGGMPEVTTGIPDGETELYQRITYRRFLDAEDVGYEVQASNDFQNWIDLDESHVVSVENVEGERHELITVRDSEPVSAGSGRFMRVRVTRD